MPILRDIQQGLREVGRIRCGDRVKSAPRKLDRFRFTADDPELLGVVADLYGGGVEPWGTAPSGEQWQVYATAERIPVMVVPGLTPISQWYELWSGGGCQRRCDGVRETLTGNPCLCVDAGENLCKPTTRLSVVLPEIRGLGIWRLESHGWYAARELGGTLALLERVARASGDPITGTLRLTQRTQRVGGQTRHYAVPTLDIAATLPELAQRVALGRPEGALERPRIDGANAQRVTALAAAERASSGPRGFPTDQGASDDRARAKLARKRTPDLGPGRRGKAVEPEPPWGAPEVEVPLPPEGPWVTIDVGTPADAEIAEAFDNPISPAQLRAMQTLFRTTGMSDRDERLMFAARIIGRSISSSKELTSREASEVLDTLTAVDSGVAEYVVDDSGRITGARFKDPPTVIEVEFPQGDDGDD